MLIRLVMYILFGVFTNKYVPFNIFWSHSHVLLEIFQNVTYIVSVSETSLTLEHLCIEPTKRIHILFSLTFCSTFMGHSPGSFIGLALDHTSNTSDTICSHQS